MKKYLFLVPLVLLYSGLSGCSDEPREFTYYEAGEYKGSEDPLLAKKLNQELNRRFTQVQTDR